MANEVKEKPSKGGKSFLSVGPTLHYSHSNVLRCWFLAMGSFILLSLFWSRLVSGVYISFDPQAIYLPHYWGFGRFLTSGASIFEYPWQILILGAVMGTMTVVPLLVSQLFSFRHSIFFILAVALLANLPFFALTLVISCIAVACRPLRFRSRFISIALCMAPQLFYWGYFGSIRGVDPIIWGYSFTPWITAWISALAVAGVVLGIGHKTRYKPGLIWWVCILVLVAGAWQFENKIGFDELDYQLFVANYNPEQASAFHDNSISKALDRTMENDAVKRYLAGFFYPADPNQLRAELKKEIQKQLVHDRWPSWFILPGELDFQQEKERYFQQYNRFIDRRPKSKRMPIALYYKAILSEFNLDIEAVGSREVLRNYWDYPFEQARKIWHRLYTEFGDSPESLEARWRIAMHWAGQGKFQQAGELLDQAMNMSKDILGNMDQRSEIIVMSAFRDPAETVMTQPKLLGLQQRISRLRRLIVEENHLNDDRYKENLARFVRLNWRNPEYRKDIEAMLEEFGPDHPLTDNLKLAQARLIQDERQRAERLKELYKDYQDTDAALDMLFEMANAQIHLWQKERDPEIKNRILQEARASLASFLSLYPNSILAKQAKKNLDDLPSVD